MINIPTTDTKEGSSLDSNHVTDTDKRNKLETLHKRIKVLIRCAMRPCMDQETVKMASDIRNLAICHKSHQVGVEPTLEEFLAPVSNQTFIELERRVESTIVKPKGSIERKPQNRESIASLLSAVRV